ncbi:uncharacterized protein Z519_00290 [Cladophialophora bantiana CBS 173.52]|uniref:Glutamate--cysteine ligase n=1 Tax=Cladophialophora bantiana (strain ATCC 10958 / CBS 173.52 / CDC B-1940 / NIH 8579) TaxID=1442370 RepID=A0A0D2IPC9_CLAB1|nr:uncharacterized protein Z519_00290 [Cladophialophora bantiana CBS 173.52]KIW98629.1 hypothetical protein Z519_00290 [Cladophialophora bantiana CBS 173.52]
MKASPRIFYMAIAWPSGLAFATSKSRSRRKTFGKHATFMISSVVQPPEIKADPAVKEYLEQHSGMDALLASHYAKILARDPIALAKNELKSYESLDVFEILHSAVWPHADLKLPSKNGEAGWRVEFRPLEVQLTDFENAAFAVFIAPSPALFGVMTSTFIFR